MRKEVCALCSSAPLSLSSKSHPMSLRSEYLREVTDEPELSARAGRDVQRVRAAAARAEGGGGAGDGCNRLSAAAAPPPARPTAARSGKRHANGAATRSRAAAASSISSRSVSVW
jgi:hypothetical protein